MSPRGILLVIAGLAACGGVDDASQPAEPPVFDHVIDDRPADGIGIAIDPEGLTSGDHVNLISGSNILFINGDNVAHQIASDGLDTGEVNDPCAELNLPALQIGERIRFKLTGPPRTCRFHDHLDHEAWWFRATITVVSEVYRNSE